MPKWKDISGKRFGRLVALERTEQKIHGKYVWLCQCDCGQQTFVPVNSRTTANTKSCGCLHTEFLVQKNKDNAYSVNHSFFSVWSEEMAYVLGFWAADGWFQISGKSTLVCFGQNEKRILSKIKLAMESKHPIAQYAKHFRLSITSEQMCRDICTIFKIQIGRKSLTLPFPNIPTEYIKHFIRGYVDGDGSCVLSLGRYPRLSITTGSKKFAIHLKDIIENILPIKLNSRKDTRGNGCYTLDCSGEYAVIIHNWLYSNATIFLERKKRAFYE